MNKNTFAFVIVAALGGFVAGFWLANSINRSQMMTPTTQNTTQNAAPAPANSNVAPVTAEPDLSDAEIKAKVAEADNNPSSLTFQKDLGISLYRYSAMKMDAKLLDDVIRILTRANTLSPKDFDILVALGNAYFDVGFAKKDSANYQKAREVYSKALEIQPGDADVMTDFGLTYFLQDPPEYSKASAELQKVSNSNPSHQRSLQFLVQTLLKQNKGPEAEKAFAKLKTINPTNAAIPELTSLIAAQPAK